jgi:hypothetical protein
MDGYGNKLIIKIKHIKMQLTTKISRTGRRRQSNRPTSYYRLRNRMSTSHGQPVHISFYLRPLIGTGGNIDNEKIINLFNTEYYG